MRKVALVVSASLLLASCGAGEPRDRAGSAGSSPSPSPASPAQSDVERTVAIYSAVIRRLVTVDHTYGKDPGFEILYVLDGVSRGAGDPEKSGTDRPAEPFSDEVKSGIEQELADLPPIEFVRDPDSVIVDEKKCAQVDNDGVVISLDEIVGKGNRVKVGNGLFIACLAGQWLTYVLKRKHDRWRVTGTAGPVAIS